jgi:plasmid stability protein
MAQILVRDMDEVVVRTLKKRAKVGKRSLQSEVKAILEHAAAEQGNDFETTRALVHKIRMKFKGRKFPDSVNLIREDRGR